MLLWEQNVLPIRAKEPPGPILVRNTIPDWWQCLRYLQSQRVGEVEKRGHEVLCNQEACVGGKGR